MVENAKTRKSNIDRRNVGAMDSGRTDFKKDFKKNNKSGKKGKKPKVKVHDGHYTNQEYRALTDDERAKVRDLRKNRGDKEKDTSEDKEKQRSIDAITSGDEVPGNQGKSKKSLMAVTDDSDEASVTPKAGNAGEQFGRIAHGKGKVRQDVKASRKE